METSGSNLIILWTNIYRAEAEKMRMKASAYKQYGDAAILSLVLEALPQVRLSVTQTICITGLHWLLYTNIFCRGGIDIHVFNK